MQIQNTKTMKLKFATMKNFFNLILIFTLLLGSALNTGQPAKADDTHPMNGSWQYLVRRKDGKGGIGNFGDPNCPFYVGYFTLDVKKVRGANIQEVNLFRDNDIQIIPVSSTQALHVTNLTEERRGSYTPVGDNSRCKMPPTQVLDERAPISIRRFNQATNTAEWHTAFSRGNYKADVVWKTKAKYIPATDEILGDLQVYACNGHSASSVCSIMNTTKFVAKRVKDIDEAAQKPLSAQFPEFKLKAGELAAYVLGQLVDSGDLTKLASADYVRSSIKAVMPAFAQHSGTGALQRANCANNSCWCLNPGDVRSACVKCTWVNCPGKEGQAAPAGREELCNDKYTQGRCFDERGQISCNKYGSC
jgi:hypothetical protein